MTEKEAMEKLEDEGFESVYAGRQAPESLIEEHGHATRSVVIIVDGEMTIIEGGATRRYGPGDCFEVPAGEVHAARAGARGCHYVVGE